MASITFDQVELTYPGSTTTAVKDLDLEIEDGEFMVLVGPSGCGKSTSLRMLAGLEEATNGRILIGAEDVTRRAPKDRDIAMVFQNYALYPHMTVADNMAFSLRMAGVPKVERMTRVREAAQILDLAALLDRKPKALSGGQRQRVAMGRAIVRQPRVFCMDEPLSNLDAKLRVTTRAQIAALQRRLGITTVYVTHDQVEAMTMGDRVAVMRNGVLQQVDSPLGLYDRPANVFVAGFMGSPAMNLLEVDVVDGRALIGAYEVPVDARLVARASGRVVIGIRPEAWHPVSPGAPALAMIVDVVEELGADAYLYGATIHAGSSIPLTARLDGVRNVAKGSTVHLAVDPAQVHLFDAASGERLRP